MFNPEPLDLAVSMLCLYLAARMLVGRRFGLGAAATLGIALGCGEMVRQFSLWTLAVVVLAFLVALSAHSADRRAIVAALVVVAAACAVVALPWYVYRAQNYGNPVFDRPQAAESLWRRRPARFYVDPGLHDVFSRPYRPNLVNLAVPQTYADIWGDWYGVFHWSSATQAKPSEAKNRWLVLQMVVGIVPTLLAVAGWLLLLVRSLRKRDAPTLLVALLPLAGIAGYLYFTVSFPTADGDVLKPTYMLTTLGAWALCFGWAATTVARHRPRLIVVLLALLALLDVPFAIYRGGVGLF